ncbi:MAG: RNA polymerase sigma factor [Anaerolineales bacterium]|jgi:DNA-directed RNA polymerase specialized sigma24 family protein
MNPSAKNQAAELHRLTLSGLRHRCAVESDRFFRRQAYDPRYCYELFRRAVLEQDEHAWELLYVQYQPLVTGWIERNSLFYDTGESAEYFVNRAFEKMWSAISPEKFSRFPDLKSILRYLQMCVHSVVVDHARASERTDVLEEEGEERLTEQEIDARDPEAIALQLQNHHALWQAVEQRLKDNRERCVVYGSYVLGMKPSEVQELYQAVFADVREVYAVKDNLLARLRRDEELQEFLKSI